MPKQDLPITLLSAKETRTLEENIKAIDDILAKQEDQKTKARTKNPLSNWVRTKWASVSSSQPKFFLKQETEKQVKNLKEFLQGIKTFNLNTEVGDIEILKTLFLSSDIPLEKLTTAPSEIRKLNTYRNQVFQKIIENYFKIIEENANKFQDRSNFSLEDLKSLHKKLKDFQEVILNNPDIIHKYEQLWGLKGRAQKMLFSIEERIKYQEQQDLIVQHQKLSEEFGKEFAQIQDLNEPLENRLEKINTKYTLMKETLPPPTISILDAAFLKSAYEMFEKEFNINLKNLSTLTKKLDKNSIEVMVVINKIVEADDLNKKLLDFINSHTNKQTNLPILQELKKLNETFNKEIRNIKINVGNQVNLLPLVERYSSKNNMSPIGIMFRELGGNSMQRNSRRNELAFFQKVFDVINQNKIHINSEDSIKIILGAIRYLESQLQQMQPDKKGEIFGGVNIFQDLLTNIENQHQLVFRKFSGNDITPEQTFFKFINHYNADFKDMNHGQRILKGIGIKIQRDQKAPPPEVQKRMPMPVKSKNRGLLPKFNIRDRTKKPKEPEPPTKSKPTQRP